MGNKWPALFVKKPLGKGDLLPTHKILIERPVQNQPCCIYPLNTKPVGVISIQNQISSKLPKVIVAPFYLH